MEPSQQDVFVKKEWFILEQKKKLEEVYDIKTKKDLGSGAYGTVFKVKVINSDEERAVKLIPKQRIKNPKEFLNEVNIMKTLDHPNVIKLFEIFEDSRNVYLVMEKCDGGELFDSIIAKGKLTEIETRHIFSQVSSAILYCHNHGICHRDLKPENFLLLNNKENSPIKVIDFGLSCVFLHKVGEKQEKEKMNLKAGSAYYMSPEVLKGDYDELCDVWSLGVILYIMLSGVPPFYGNTDPQIFAMIQKGVFNLDLPQLKSVSQSAKDLIKKCIAPVEKRLKASEIFDQPWMKEELPNVPVAELTLQQLKEFFSNEKLKKIALSYIASQLSQSEIIELGNLFSKLDVNKDGVLSFQEIKAGMKDLDESSTKELEKILQSIDTDGSGTIDFTEFIAASIEKNIYMKQEKLYSAFKMFDVDGSGKIDKKELIKILGTTDDYKNVKEDYWDNIIKEVDKNGDGEIDYNEFVSMMQNKK